MFAESRAAELMKGLRVIVQHRKLPGLLGGLEQVVGGPLKSTVHVDRDDLLEWNGWSAAMRASLESDDHDDVVINEIVAEYRDGVVGFHGWFHSIIRQRNAAALEDFERQRQELAEYAKGMFGPPIDDPSSEPT